MQSRQLSAAISAILLLSVAAIAEDFAQFRGSNGGQVQPQSIPKNWSLDKNLGWKVTIPGSGWSQPIVVGEKLFVTSAVSDKERKPKNFAEGTRNPASMGLGFLSSAPRDEFKWTVFCLDAQTGEVEWSTVVNKGRAKYAIHPSNTYATETPAADENGIYVYFGATGIVAGLSLDGEINWQRDVGVFKTSNNFGTGSSLAIHDGKLYVQNFTEGSASLLCLNTHTGSTIWEDSREKNVTAWCSPLIWKNKMRTELIVSSERELTGYDPATGEELWSLTNVKSAAACSPCADAGNLYFGGSDPFSKGPLVALAAGATGQIGPEKKNQEFDQCSWLQPRSGPGMASPVSSGQYVYVVDRNVLRCYDASSGERYYQKRIPEITMVAASPLIVGDELLVVDEDGNAALIATGKDFEQVGSGSLPDIFWASPAVAGGSIYLRGVENLYCLRQAE